MGSGLSKTGVSKKGDSKPKINSQVQPLSYKKMEDGQESGHSQTNESKTDLNSNSSASKADGDVNAEEPKLQSNTDNTDKDGGVKHQTAHSSAQDDRDNQQEDRSDNVRTERDDTNKEQSKSNNSIPKENKENDNTSSTSEDKIGMFRESESGHGNTSSENIGPTDDTENNHDINLTEKSGIETKNESNCSIDIDEKTDPNPSTLASHTTTSNDSVQDGVEFQNNLNDNTVDSGHAVAQSGDVDKDVKASAQSNANENPPLENSKDKKKEEAELSEYRLNDNVLFYRNKLCSKPFPGATIEEMLTWKGDYQKLERSHSYIQWLFPIPESRGMNYSAQPLQEHEAQIISEDEDLKNKVLEAFKMMLDFYGMELDSNSMTIKRTENWAERYENLNRSTHNRFRITRIIKAIGELGWECLQVPWIEFIMHEAITNKVLSNLTDQNMSHFIDAIKEEDSKWKLYAFMSDLNSHSRSQDKAHEPSKPKQNVNAIGGNGQIIGGKKNNETPDSNDQSVESVGTNGNETKGEHGDATDSDKVNEIGENDGEQNRSDSTDKIISKEVNGAKTKQGGINSNDTIGGNNCKPDGTDISCDNCAGSKETNGSHRDGETKINDTMAAGSKTNEIQGNCVFSETAGVEKETSGVNGNERQDTTTNTCGIDDNTTYLKDENVKGKEEPIIKDKSKHGFKETADVNEKAVIKTRNDGRESLNISCGDKTTSQDSSIEGVNNTVNDKDGSENTTVDESLKKEEKRNEVENCGSDEGTPKDKQRKNKQRRDGSENNQSTVEI